ncbi:MAG: TIR domain-containing protein [Chloroflexi bacterium]|nr:TIR domain-containing protein [Chloroflexota bacterium]
MDESQRWDVFISYASEDREAVARPLALLLRQLGLRVWYDEMELRVGDRLRRRIDEGLTKCRYGVVILSPSFPSKHYPQLELDGLMQREQDGRDLILPPWRDVEAEDVRRFLPTLADRFALKWKDGIHAVAIGLLRAVSPDLYERIQEEGWRLARAEVERITSAVQLTGIIGNAFGLSFRTDDVDGDETEVIGGFQQELRDWMDIWRDIGPASHAEASTHLGERLSEIRDMGWSVYGRLERRSVRFGDITESMPIGVIAIVRGESSGVFSHADGVEILREDGGPGGR